MKAVEIGAPIPAKSGPPMFVKAPVLEIPAVVEHVQRGSNTYHCLSGPSDHIDSGAEIATVTMLKTFQLRNRVCYPQRKLYRKQ